MSGRPLILIIDDEHDFRAICAHVLDRGGYDTVTAGDGGAGLAAFTERRPDLIVLDGNLPDLDGIEVCRRLRKLPGGVYLYQIEAEGKVYSGSIVILK